MPTNETTPAPEPQGVAVTITCPHCHRRHDVSLSRMMRKIGKIKSARKSVSSRENGRLGGRPIDVNSKLQQRLMAKVGSEPSRN